MKATKQNYELLRIIAAIAVIAIHVSGSYTMALNSSEWLGDIYTSNYLITCIYNCCSRFAVPIFIMLAGAFAISNEENANYKKYYTKIFKRIVIPTVVFSLICIVYNAIKIYYSPDRMRDIKRYIIDLIKGKPYYHMWYLYMMISVYLFTPIVIRIKQDIGESRFVKMGIVFFGICTICLATSKHSFEWDVTMSFGYLGYFIMGYIIKKLVTKTSNAKGTVSIIIGVGILGILTYLNLDVCETIR